MSRPVADWESNKELLVNLFEELLSSNFIDPEEITDGFTTLLTYFGDAVMDNPMFMEQITALMAPLLVNRMLEFSMFETLIKRWEGEESVDPEYEPEGQCPTKPTNRKPVGLRGEMLGKLFNHMLDFGGGDDVIDEFDMEFVPDFVESDQIYRMWVRMNNLDDIF